MARRRAEKAAEGKRANAEAAKQRFKRKKGERAEAARLDSDDRQGNEEIEQKLSVVEDQKEAKRLKRYFATGFQIPSFGFLYTGNMQSLLYLQITLGLQASPESCLSSASA